MRHPSFASVRLAATLVLVLLALTLSGAHSTAQVTTLPVTAGIAVAPPFTGIAPSSSNPPDLTIAAGLDRLVIGSNDVVVIRDKTGALIASKDLRVLFASVRAPGEDTVFSPRVVFDPDSERFFLIAAAHNRPACVPTCVSHYLLAVSKSGTPATLDAADWHFDTLDASSDNTGTGPAGDGQLRRPPRHRRRRAGARHHLGPARHRDGRFRHRQDPADAEGVCGRRHQLHADGLAGLRQHQRAGHRQSCARRASGRDVRRPQPVLPDQPRAGPGEQRLQHGGLVARQPGGADDAHRESRDQDRGLRALAGRASAERSDDASDVQRRRRSLGAPGVSQRLALGRRVGPANGERGDGLGRALDADQRRRLAGDADLRPGRLHRHRGSGSLPSRHHGRRLQQRVHCLRPHERRRRVRVGLRHRPRGGRSGQHTAGAGAAAGGCGRPDRVEPRALRPVLRRRARPGRRNRVGGRRIRRVRQPVGRDGGQRVGPAAADGQQEWKAVPGP